MTPMQRITREPNLTLGVLTAAFGVAVLFGVPVTAEQVGGIMTLAGALMALVRYMVTPTAEVVATQRPDQETPQAGPAASVATGSDVQVVSTDWPTVGDVLDDLPPGGPVLD